MKKAILLLLLFSFVFHIKGQYLIPGKWYKGEVVFNNKELRQGELQLDLSNNLLHFKDDSSAFIFLPSQINHFKFYSESKKNALPRIFAPLKYANGNQSEGLVYFELLYIGKTTSLMVKGKEVNSPVYSSNPAESKPWNTEIEYDYFIQFRNGDIKKFTPLNPRVIKLLEDEKEKIKSYIKSNSLNCSNFYHLVKVIEYYDQLKLKDEAINN